MKTTTPVLSAAFLAAILGAPPVVGQGTPPNAGPVNTLLSLVEPKTIFVTSETYNGDLVAEANGLLGTSFTDEEGLEAADAICQYHADHPDSIVPHGTYVALISGHGTPAAARLTAGIYPILRPDGAYVAQSPADLFIGQGLDTAIAAHLYLIAPVGKTEDGGAIVSLTWTGSRPNGLHRVSCHYWATEDEDEDGGIGHPQDVTRAWLAQGEDGCDQHHHLYCVQR